MDYARAEPIRLVLRSEALLRRAGSGCEGWKSSQRNRKKTTDFTDAVLSGAKNPAGCRMLRLRLSSANPCKSVSKIGTS